MLKHLQSSVKTVTELWKENYFCILIIGIQRATIIENDWQFAPEELIRMTWDLTFGLTGEWWLEFVSTDPKPNTGFAPENFSADQLDPSSPPTKYQSKHQIRDPTYIQ